MSNLELVKSDTKNFHEHYDNMIKKINKKKLIELEPTLDEVTKIYEIILNYIKEKKRKLSGGYALNKLLIAKNKNLAIYDENDTPDVDCYSPEPIKDVIALSNILYKNGFKYIVAQEAQHPETYNIFVNFHEYVNFSYMPVNVFNKVRYVEIEGIYVIHPWFMMVDFFRMFCEPLNSYWKLDKHFDRYKTLEHQYPLPKFNKEFDVPKNIPKLTNEHYEQLDIFFNYFMEFKTFVMTGFYTYNYYVHANKQNNFINIPYYEIYSIDYINDGKKLIEFVKDLNNSDIHYDEFYPFFQFFDYSLVIYYKNKPLIYLYGNNKRCIPFKNVELINFKNKDTLKIKNKTINICSFDANILHQLTLLVKVRIDNNNDENDTIYKHINLIVSMRNYYLLTNKKDIYDNTIYESFVIDCIGTQYQPKREKLLANIERRKQKKQQFRYEPEYAKDTENDVIINYKFKNTSGNVIKNEKNLILTEYKDIEQINEQTNEQINEQTNEEKNKQNEEEINDNV